jgi:hypothetical protein
VVVALLAGAGAVAGRGSRGGGEHLRGAGGSWESVDIGHAIRVSYPPGWHLLEGHVTSLSYPSDRMLLTSYPAVRGGDCSPTRAEQALAPGGALIYLFEYPRAPGSVVGPASGAEFPPLSSGFSLKRRDLANYECWRVPSYLMRFTAARRLFQVHVAFGAGVTASRRSQALLVLRRMSFTDQASPPPARGS